ncbi:MAG: mechanosensitive ion channel family protein [Tannerellaceae bacterium]|nr:mechanosensitive ion channel family protein [Tannerellaceae bacterium]
MEIYIPQLIATGIALLIISVSKFLSRKLINRYGVLLQKSEIRRRQIKQLISIILNILFIIVLAIIWGVQPHNLLIGLSSIFTVIGVAFFAQWSILSNVTAGIIMFFNSTFRLGDRIRILDKDMPIEATIEHIHAFYTHIRTSDGEEIVIPNNIFLQKIVAVKNSNQ